MYEIKRLKNSTWEIIDTSHETTIQFREGMFNETQEVNTPEWLTDAQVIAGILRYAGEWAYNSVPDIVTCNIEARKSVIYKIEREEWWMLLTRLPDINPTGDTGVFCYGVKQLVRDEDLLGYYEVEDGQRLLKVCSSLNREQVSEVYRILRSQQILPGDNLYDWARDLLWWPAWVPEKTAPDPSSLTDYLREEMKQQGVTYAELAKRTGINPANLNLILNGNRTPKIDSLIAIAEALGFEVRLNKQQ